MTSHEASSSKDESDWDVLSNDRTLDQRHAAMAMRRETCPIGPAGTELPGAWYLASHSAVSAVLPAINSFGGAAGAGDDVPHELQGFNGYPEPLHGQVRKVVNGLIAGHRARKAEPYIRSLAHRLIDDLAHDTRSQGPYGEVDIAAGLIDQLPCAVIAWMFGWPTDDPVQLYRWTVTLCEHALEMSPGSSLTSAELCPEYAAYVDARIDERLSMDKQDWPDDGLSHMLTAEIEGEQLSPTMVRTQLMFVLGAASETSRDLLGGVLLYLARDPALYERIRNDRSLIPTAIEEALRLAAPVQYMVRRCLEPAEVDGQTFDPGDIVVLGLASANVDESAYTDSYQFDVDRPNARSHHSFGGGTHVCPGAALARTEGQTVLAAFLDRFSSISLPESETTAIPLAMFNGPQTLRLRLTVDESYGQTRPSPVVQPTG